MIPSSPGPRLYASTDELAYTTTYTGTTPARSLVNTSVASLTSAVVAKVGFFLTAHSRAPEVNLFNRPRVTIWPEAATTADSDGTTTIMGNRTTFDKAIAFCSTVGGSPFYFVRTTAAAQRRTMRIIRATKRSIPTSRT